MLESRGIQLPHHPHHHRHEADDEDDGHTKSEYGRRGHVKNRSLPLSTLIEILKQKTGMEDIDVGKLRPTLFDIFGEDASPKVKKFIKVIMNKLQQGESSEGGGFMGIVGSLAQEFLKTKLEETDEDYVRPAMETKVHSSREVYAGATKIGLPDNGILISGCQANQTSADASGPDGAYGALSNAIQAILAESDSEITNQELVLRARVMLGKDSHNILVFTAVIIMSTLPSFVDVINNSGQCCVKVNKGSYASLL